MHFPLSLPADKPYDAVGFGLNAVDHLIVVPEYPAFDTKMRLLEHTLSAGGQTATAMVAVSPGMAPMTVPTATPNSAKAKFSGVRASRKFARPGIADPKA